MVRDGLLFFKYLLISKLSEMATKSDFYFLTR